MLPSRNGDRLYQVKLSIKITFDFKTAKTYGSVPPGVSFFVQAELAPKPELL